MSHLQSLKVVTSKRPTRLSPIQYRRNKLIVKLHEQLQCANARIDGRDLFLTRQRNVKNSESGQRLQIEQQYRVKPWWFTNDEGKTIFEVRYGSRVIEIAKGKTGIEVDTLGDLPSVIEVMKKAVDAGELDAGINALAGAFGSQRGKK